MIDKRYRFFDFKEFGLAEISRNCQIPNHRMTRDPMELHLGICIRMQILGVSNNESRNSKKILFMIPFILYSICAPCESASTISIMALGDSITWGYSPVDVVPGGYRAVLYRDLTAAGYSVQMVGSETSNPDPTLPAAANGQEGHTGYFIDGQGVYATTSLNNHISTWLTPGNGINPNLILLEIGTNNIYGNYQVSGAPYALAALITEITRLRPNSEVLLSTITPLANATLEAEVQQFNKSLGGSDGIVAQLQALGENIELVNAGGSLSKRSLARRHPPIKGRIYSTRQCLV